jgi:hypothetical protein
VPVEDVMPDTVMMRPLDAPAVSKICRTGAKHKVRKENTESRTMCADLLEKGGTKTLWNTISLANMVVVARR